MVAFVPPVTVSIAVRSFLCNVPSSREPRTGKVVSTSAQCRPSAQPPICIVSRHLFKPSPLRPREQVTTCSHDRSTQGAQAPWFSRTSRAVGCRQVARSSEGVGERELWSVVIPTYNRLPILEKCLDALENQLSKFHPDNNTPLQYNPNNNYTPDPQDTGHLEYEVIVVDDASTDSTVPFLSSPAAALRFPHVRLLSQPQNTGPAEARNVGVRAARGSVIVFIDSDLVVTPRFLGSHKRALEHAQQHHSDSRTFSYGRVVNTSNFHHPQSEPFKITDVSAAFFATGNVAISRDMLQEASLLLKPLHPQPSPHPWGGERGEGTECGGEWVGAGPFDPEFCKYGWEDLELGERLRSCGARIVQCPEAVGFHWHPPFSIDQLPGVITREEHRAKNAVLFFRKHPGSVHVRLMLQLTPLHWLIWGLLTLGGRVNAETIKPALEGLLNRGQEGLAVALLSPALNWHYLVAMQRELDASGEYD